MLLVAFLDKTFPSLAPQKFRSTESITLELLGLTKKKRLDIKNYFHPFCSDKNPLIVFRPPRLCLPTVERCEFDQNSIFRNFVKTKIQ